jgi:fructan beta-fructosidase
MVRPVNTHKYLLLPIEEKAGESRISLIVDNQTIHTMHVRLAVNKVDYYVPYGLSGYDADKLVLDIQGVTENALCWQEMKLSDSFDKQNRELYRPIYHFTPEYGWMNDPNGMVYKDGEYHLFYQYNPYGSMWGNMHWGHAISKDLVSWQHLPVAIAPDGLGTIFSGSCVVDKNNTAGFGKGAIVAFYTSAGNSQTQSMAYSLDNGRTFKKHSGNPVVMSDLRDFRDPKVSWHEPTQKWIMILAAGQEMQIYSSPNLIDWTYESSFGKGQGAHGGVWECPDLVQLPVKGTDKKKWVLICNINPGGPFGGSATQYFVGQFDGHRFVNESPDKTKWMDWGKDHYATVTWSNAPDNRTIALAWMSNWDYANNVPTTQYRSANSVPRDLFLYESQGDTYMASVPSKELLALRDKGIKKGSFKVNKEYEVKNLLKKNEGAYEIELVIKNEGAQEISFCLYNAKGEEVVCTYNLDAMTFSMDRTRSGQVSFSKSFPVVTSAPVVQQDTYKLRLLVDKSSIEAFGDEGQFVMTNLVFPKEPYNRMKFTAKGGSCRVISMNIYKLNH